METTRVRNQPRPVEYDVQDDDDLYTVRLPSSARRYRASQPTQQNIANEPVTENGTLMQRRRPSLSPKNTNGIVSNAVTSLKIGQQEISLVPVLLGMVTMIFLVVALGAFGSWWRVYQDDLRYGRPRAFHMEAVVGHGDSPANPTLFILINLNRHVEIIEMPGGDARHTRLFSGPVLLGDGMDLQPVTGEVRDVNGDGKPDLIVHIQDQQIIFINNGTTFLPK